MEYRNKRPGHGVSDASVITEWSEKTFSILKDCLEVFSPIIPIVDESGNLRLSKEFKSFQINTPVLEKGRAIVIMSVFARKGVWKLRGQQLSHENAEEFTVDLPEDNIFSTKGLRPANEYKLTDIVSNNKSYSFFHNIPIRQTDTFEGRKDELKALVDWIDDEDSRYCLVYGDGGYGKTTFVLEMLNQFMESQYDFKEPIPTIISYHSAKLTRWTEKGLIHFTSITPAMDECIRELMRCFYPILPSEWYGVTGKQLIDKAVGVLKKNKFNRDNVLLIVDNTETLATNSQEVKDLGAFFKLVGKLIGRIIITSRRREFIEATPIVIEGLSEIEGVALMKRIAEEYNAKPILQAGEAKLRKVSNQLMRKPILLEALVKYIARTSRGINSAIDNVFRKSNEDLLEFLYEDAWLRMSALQKEVFFVIIHVSCPLNQASIGQACLEVGIQHTEFQSGLAETHFAILIDYGKTYSLELVDLADRFFLQEFGKLNNAEKDRLKLFASKVDSYILERENIEKEYRTDRVAEAFRSEYAKAAKVYADKGDIKNAIDMYELAIEDDPVNSALHDRFSWLLLNRTEQYEYAEKISKKAIELDENNCDAIVGLALAYYRIGNISEGDNYIDQARAKGRTYSFSYLRKAIARYHKEKNEADINSKILLLEDAFEKLEKAERINSQNGGYDAKNLKEINRYKELTMSKLSVLRVRRTKIGNSIK